MLEYPLCEGFIRILEDEFDRDIQIAVWTVVSANAATEEEDTLDQALRGSPLSYQLRCLIKSHHGASGRAAFQLRD